MRKNRKALISIVPLLLIILCAFYLFHKVLFPPEGKMIFGMDISDAYFYWKQYLRFNILSGSIPFWNPYNFSGTPFLAHPNINIFYPPNWIFILFPPDVSFALYFFIHVVWAGVTMYVLCRQYTDRWGSTAASVVYAFGGYMAARIYSGHLEYIDTASWVPLAFAFIRTMLQRPSKRNILRSILVLSMLLLSGNELFFLFTMEIVGLYIVYSAVSKPVGSIGYLLLVIICAFGLSAVQLLPRFEFLSQSLRSTGVPYSIAGSGSLPPAGLLLFLNPFYWGLPFSEHYTYNGPWPNLFEFTYYVGIFPVIFFLEILILLLLRLFFKKLKKYMLHPDSWFYVIAIGIFILISLGTYANINVHELLWKYTPFYKSIRFPARHLFLVAFSLSVLMGMVVGSIKQQIIKGIIICIVVFDLLRFDKQFFRLSLPPTHSFDQALIEAMKKETGIYRVLPDYPVVSSVRRDFDFGAFATNGIPATSDYNSMVLGRYYRFIDLLNKSTQSSITQYNVEIPPPNPHSPYVNFMNVRYVLVDRGFDAIEGKGGDRYTQVMEGTRYKLYKNNQELPRFFLVPRAEKFPTDQMIEQALLNDTDLSKTVLLGQEKLPDALDCPDDFNGNVSVVTYTARRIVLHTDASCNSMLSSSEVYYPGWHATIDGESTPIFRSNAAFRAFFVPKGSHTIEMIYQPTIWYIGGAVSLLTSGVLWIVFKKRNV